MFCVVLALLSTTQIRAYTGPPIISSARQCTYLKITSKEILDRARKASGIADEEPTPMIFDEYTLGDIESALLKLERRAQEGPGALSMLEVEEFDGEMTRIISEMNHNPHKRIPRPVRKEKEGPSSAPSTSYQGQPTSQLPQSSQSQARPRTIMDTSEDEGPAYDGTGGMGQPRGTVNTYVIDGMDAMSPEEYQKALQDSIIQRQRKRRDSGITGNRATWDYLGSLGGSTGVLKEEKDGDGDQKNYRPF